MKSFANALIVATSASLSLGGQPSAQTPEVALGQGTMSCATWLDGTARANPDSDQVSWTLGYISAVASSGASLKSVTESYVRGWMEGYCEKHRTVTIAAATRELVAQLKAAK
jgi:hypothetical protein